MYPFKEQDDKLRKNLGKCPLCKRKHTKNSESKLKVYSGLYTDVTKLKIYNHICMGCFNIIVRCEE